MVSIHISQTIHLNFYEHKSHTEFDRKFIKLFLSIRINALFKVKFDPTNEIIHTRKIYWDSFR